MKAWLAPESRKRRIVLGLILYGICTAVFFATAAPERLTDHTPYNHFALLADSWLHGRLELRGSPPPYAGGNDFALFQGKWFISFPPFPAVWLLPWVALAGNVDQVRDGQAFMWLAGIGPAVLWLVLEKLRRTGHSDRRERTDFLLALLFAFGTVYWFTSVQGTVWFAAHVVAVALAALYLLFAVDAERPVLAGLMLGFAWMTRPPMLLMAIVFVLEAVRISAGGSLPQRRAGVLTLLHDTWRALNVRRLAKLLGLFAAPLLVLLALSMWHNYARFGDPFEFGHKLLTVAWRARMEKWGLFSYHYLPRNLGVVLTSLPYLNRVPSGLQINAHGLALWFTSPFLLWLLWPRRKDFMFWSFALAAAAVALVGLLYQNTGWMQFGYRFSNDFAVLLFVLLALCRRRFTPAFMCAAAFAIVVNGFGALTFDRPQHAKYYFIDHSQKILYQPD